MIRIGIIGAQSMHSWSFAAAVNIPNENGEYLVPDTRVVAICGVDETEEKTQEAAQKGNIPTIVKEVEELYDLCDAVMILPRKGDEHIKYAIPFIQKGYPVFIDKPICISDEDISLLKSEAEANNAIIAGGSGLKNCGSVRELKAILESGELGNIKGITVNHNADIESPYNGIYFYACHAVEIMLSLLGNEISSIDATALNRNNFSAYVKYADKFANLVFTTTRKYFVTVYGDQKTINFEIDQSDIFKNTIVDFADKIRNKEVTKNIESLLDHVYILRSINDALMA